MFMNYKERVWFMKILLGLVAFIILVIPTPYFDYKIFNLVSVKFLIAVALFFDLWLIHTGRG